VINAPIQADLERTVTGRAQSFFADDVASHGHAIRDAVDGRRVLVVGGGGSIGSATLRALLPHCPSALHVVDISENYLTELVRDVRSGTIDTSGIELATHVFDYGSATMKRFLAAMPRFDVVLNFAAVKHVRSEKDVYSLLHMLDVNIVRQARFKQWLAELGHDGRFFTVSTDKAANPVSLMGASKRVMEDVAFDIAVGAFASVTSARFANVVFSHGSLLESFIMRLEKRQPLAVPRDTRRYFITHAEAADICLLASLIGADNHVVVPSLDPEEHLILLEDTAVRVLAAFGLKAIFTEDEAEAKQMVESASAHGRWPVLRTPLDTSGEKPFEEFVGEGERDCDLGFVALRGIHHHRSLGIERVLAELQRAIDGPTAPADKESLTRLLESAVPTMRHVETGRHLDQRM
jgi:FlaA1/EpsC-like NDP-sugar epimerase